MRTISLERDLVGCSPPVDLQRKFDTGDRLLKMRINNWKYGLINFKVD